MQLYSLVLEINYLGPQSPFPTAISKYYADIKVAFISTMLCAQTFDLGLIRVILQVLTLSVVCILQKHHQHLKTVRTTMCQQKTSTGRALYPTQILGLEMIK